MNTLQKSTETATLGGGCFWCLEAVFDDLNGVISVESGYMGGQTLNPNYEQVCGGRTGHAEVVQITFDPSLVSFREILEVFFVIHDPTTLNRQGNDAGTQYRSGIYATSDTQKHVALASKTTYDALLKKQGFDAITTEILDAGPFYYAEDYHQQYLAKNPDGYCGLGGTGVSCPIPLRA